MSADWYIGDTCLIIGAGAHVPYNLPTGEGLRSQILKYSTNYINTSNEILDKAKFLSIINNSFNKEIDSFLREEFIKHHEKSSDDKKRAYYQSFIKDERVHDVNAAKDKMLLYLLDTFIENFGNSGWESIDKYLANVKIPHYSKIGKMLIAFILYRYELAIPTFQLNLDWIHFIINNFLNTNSSFDRFYNIKPKIITFNYDNILERILYHNLVFGFLYSHEEAMASLQSLEIVHVYGDIKSLHKSIEEVVLEASKNIRMVEERNDINPKIKKYIEQCHTLLFLGFSFDENNLNILFDSTNADLKNLTTVKSTNINIDVFQKNRLYSFISNAQANVKMEFFDSEQMYCYDLIKFHYNAPPFDIENLNESSD